MLGRVVCAAIVAAAACGWADADTPDDPAKGTVVIADTSESVRFWWTELALFDDQPKAWDAVASPEFSASVRALAGPFEAKVEIGALADRFVHFETFDADSLRALVLVGWNVSAWSAIVEWEGFDVFEPGIGAFYVGFNTYDVRVSRRFAARVIGGLPDGLFQASLTAGYVASTFDPVDKRFAELEVEWFQPCGNGWAFAIAPKLELGDYLHFGPEKRRDAIVGLRVAPIYNIAEGMTLTLEGQASFAFSTYSTKSGETWAVTTIFRFQVEL